MMYLHHLLLHLLCILFFLIFSFSSSSACYFALRFLMFCWCYFKGPLITRPHGDGRNPSLAVGEKKFMLPGVNLIACASLTFLFFLMSQISVGEPIAS